MKPKDTVTTVHFIDVKFVTRPGLVAEPVHILNKMRVSTSAVKKFSLQKDAGSQGVLVTVVCSGRVKSQKRKSA